jgi:hypothetical protein
VGAGKIRTISPRSGPQWRKVHWGRERSERADAGSALRTDGAVSL